MDTLVFLAIAALLTHIAEYRPVLALIAIPFAALAGTTLPDLDLTLGLGHRSGLTHSVLPVLVSLARPRWRPVAIGLALGVGLHLSADVFPNGMRGFATVKLPEMGALGASDSYLWLATNALAVLATGALLLDRFTTRPTAALVLAVIALLGVGYLFATDGGWPVLLIFTGTGVVLVRRRITPPR